MFCQQGPHCHGLGKRLEIANESDPAAILDFWHHPIPPQSIERIRHAIPV
jgi:hypothetical protein